jgi:hypothetical protein
MTTRSVGPCWAGRWLLREGEDYQTRAGRRGVAQDSDRRPGQEGTTGLDQVSPLRDSRLGWSGSWAAGKEEAGVEWAIARELS